VSGDLEQGGREVAEEASVHGGVLAGLILLGDSGRGRVRIWFHT
jgi:hypothetical protein